MSTELTRAQWTQLLAMLSLDLVAPMYDDMELPLRDHASFKAMLRTVILEARRSYELDPRAVPDVAAMLLGRLGPAGERFAAWARGVFLGYHADQPDWSAWDIVFSQWAYSRGDQLADLAPSEREACSARYRREVETEDIRRKGEQLLRMPLSDWDLEMYARQGYGASWESGPCSTVESIVRIQRLKRFASAWWRALGPAQRRSLQARAQALLAEMGVWMPGPLPVLDDLLGAA